MKLKRKLLSVLLCLMFSTGCSILPELVAPSANFLMGLYNADTYYSKECAWYEPVRFSEETKLWIVESRPNKDIVRELAQISRNNDIFKEVCDARD